MERYSLDEIGGLVGGHFQHFLPVRFFVPHNDQPGDAHVHGHPGRGADVLRILGLHQDDGDVLQQAVILLSVWWPGHVFFEG
jgi:hypothetical protein